MKDQTIIVIIVSILMFVVVGLNIPILRQLLGFIYLSFIPGFVLLRILKLDELSNLDKIIFSVGLSIAFSMFIGLLINWFYPLFGVSSPLSIFPLIITMSIITIIISVISQLVEKKPSTELNLSIKSSPKILFLILIPILAVSGAWFKNTYILLLMLAIVAITVLLTIFSKQSISTNLYAFILIIIAVSLLFHFSFISNYLTGWDVFLEYHIFNLTKANSVWDPNITFQPQTLTSMLSISILPTMFSNFLNLQGEWIFKIVYPLIFSFVPLILFRTWEQQTDKKVAFLAAFFFIFSPKFYDTSEMRQVIAELFLALLLFLIVNKKIQGRKKGILLIIFGAALVVSHYSTSYIFIFTIFFVWIFSFFSNNAKVKDGTIKLGFILLFFVMAFSWYTYVNSAPLDAFSRFVDNISNSFSIDFFNFASRGETLSGFVNPLSGPSFLHVIGNFLAKIPYLFIGIGFLELFINRIKNREMRFDREYIIMMIANAAILFAVIIVPGFGPGLVTTRFFHLTLFLLAPLCIVGGQTFFRWIGKLIFVFSSKRKPFSKDRILSLVCIVLVMIFLFKTGFLYEVTGDTPSSPSLSWKRMEMSNDVEVKNAFYGFYVPEQDVFSAIWMSNLIEDDSKIYADGISKFKVLVGYGMINWDRIYALDVNVTLDDGYIYLRSENVIEGQLRNLRFETEDLESVQLSMVSSLLNDANKIYSNGFSDVYYNQNLNSTNK